MSRRGGIDKKLEEFAASLLDEMVARKDALTFDQRIDAFKALTAYHLGVERNSVKKPDDDPGTGSSFRGWRGRLQEVSNAQ